MTSGSDKRLAYRVRVLPVQLDRARRRYQALRREAIRLGMTDLLKEGEEQ
jgi:hypothetical protein